MLNVTELNCFVAAAEEVHFGRAAARLKRTLGVKLFERANRRIRSNFGPTISMR